MVRCVNGNGTHFFAASFPGTVEVRSPAPCPVGSHAPGPASHELAGVCRNKHSMAFFSVAERAVQAQTLALFAQGNWIGLPPSPSRLWDGMDGAIAVQSNTCSAVPSAQCNPIAKEAIN